MSEPHTSDEVEPVTVQQITAAMTALGMYDGTGTRHEHDEQAARLGGGAAYRVRMVNALLGMVQNEALKADAVNLPHDARHAAWEQQLRTAGCGLDQDPAKRVEFIRWQVLRAGTPLRLMAQHHETGPIPLAAAHAASGLHILLGVIAASQSAVATGDVTTLAAQTPHLRSAREALQSAIDNADLLLNMLKSVNL